MKVFVMALLVLVLTGCAASKGFDRGALRESFGSVTTDRDIQEVLALKPQLPAPFKLGVYLNSNSWDYKRRFWTDQQKNDLVEYLKSL